MADRKPERKRDGQPELIRGAEHHGERPVPTADMTTEAQRDKWLRSRRADRSTDSTTARPPSRGDGYTNDRPPQASPGRPASRDTGAYPARTTAGGHFRPPATTNGAPPRRVIHGNQPVTPGNQPPRYAAIDPSQPATVPLPDDAVDPSRPQDPRTARLAQEARERRAYIDGRSKEHEQGTIQQAVHTQRGTLRDLRYAQADMQSDGTPDTEQQAELVNVERTEAVIAADLERDEEEIYRTTRATNETRALDTRVDEVKGMPSQSRIIKTLKVGLYDEIFDRLKGEGASIPERAAVVSKVETELGHVELSNIDNAMYAEQLGLSHEEFKQFRELHEAIHHGATRDQQEAAVQAQRDAQSLSGEIVLGAIWIWLRA